MNNEQFEHIMNMLKGIQDILQGVHISIGFYSFLIVALIIASATYLKKNDE